MGRKLSTEHPYYKKKIEIINDLSNRGLNAGDITDVERRAIEYIDRNSDQMINKEHINLCSFFNLNSPKPKLKDAWGQFERLCV